MKKGKLRGGRQHGDSVPSTLTETAWQQHRSAVLAYLRRRLADAVLAEDLTQEAFLRLHRAQPELHEPARVRAWLLRTARRLLIDHFRARKPEVPLDESLPLAGNETAAWRAFEPCIEPLARRLRNDYREALLWDLDGIPQRAIAERQGIGLSGAKTRVQRARGLLAGELTRCCDDLSDPDTALFGCAAGERLHDDVKEFRTLRNTVAPGTRLSGVLRRR